MLTKLTRAALAIAALMLLAGELSQAEARSRYGGYAPKYCMREYDGTMNCAYFDRRQCQAAVRGTGGDCAINPRFQGYPDRRAPRWKRTYR